jgi:hypothetical protein
MRRIIASLCVSTCILCLGCRQNRAPLLPAAPTGPAVGLAGESLSFLAATSDPDSDSIRYRMDWGNALGDWSRLFASAESCTLGHSWSASDTYAIRVQAEDVRGNRSEWSAYYVVSIESLCRR